MDVAAIGLAPIGRLRWLAPNVTDRVLWQPARWW
jgi:hypothetical protein